MSDKKTIFVVLGMSRSGTSAIARSLKTLGVELGDKFLPGNKINPKGFWEDVEIMYKVNRGVSAVIHQAYMHSDSFDLSRLQSDPLLKSFHASAVSLLNARLENTQHWGFKDPRTITLIPFWKSVFNTMKVEDRYVITVRNPLSAAMSNCKFIDCTLEEALLIWVRQLFTAIEETHGKKRVVVSYEAMLQDPCLQLERMQRALDIPHQLQEDEIKQYANEFLDKKLRHFTYDEAALKESTAVKMFPLLLPLHDILQQLATDQLSFDDPIFQEKWRDIKAEFSKVEPVFQYVETVQKSQKAIEKILAKIERSLAWKLLYPLRVIDRALRVRRDNRKLKKRLSVYEAF